MNAIEEPLDDPTIATLDMTLVPPLTRAAAGEYPTRHILKLRSR